MKTNKIYLKIVGVFFILLLIPTKEIKAQEVNQFYLTGMWQFNFPVNNNYANTGSGWGASIEGSYRISPSLDLGLFVNWHTNNKYIDRRTYTHETTSVTSDQYRSLFQIPFGLMANYNLLQGNIEPYVGLKIGANYAEFRTHRNTYINEDNSWGVFASPEIGINYYPLRNKNIGFKLSGYYGFGSNSYKTFDVDYINNMGARVGVIFKM